MRQTWRWFGPDDPITLPMIAEAGAAGVVTALHRHNRGQIWPLSEIEGRRAQIEAAGLTLDVVESIGVGEEIKTRSGDWRKRIDNYKQSPAPLRPRRGQGVLLQFHGDHRLDAHRPDVARARRRPRAAVRRRRFRRLRPVPARTRGRAAGLCARARRRRPGAAAAALPRPPRRPGTHADRLAARARLHLRPRQLPRGAASATPTSASRTCAPT